MSEKPESASRWLNSYLPQVRRMYFSAAVLTLSSAVCFVFFCRYLSEFGASWLVDGEIIPRNLIIATIFMAGRYVLSFFASRLNEDAGTEVVSGIKRRLYPALLQRSEIDSVSGTLTVTRISDDLKPYFASFIPNGAASVYVAGALLVVFFWVEKWVGVVLSVSLVAIPFTMSLIGTGASGIHKKHIDLFMRYSAVFYNRLHAISEIVSLDQVESQDRFLSRKSEELNKVTTRVMRVAILSSAALELFVTLSIAMIAIYLGFSLLGIMMGANYGTGYDFQTALFLLTLAPYFFYYLRKFVSSYHDRNRALAAAEAIIPWLSDEHDTAIACPDSPLESIRIEGLGYAYPDSPVKVLNGIDATFPAKGLVLVRGISGSGKSTLLKICAGSLPVSEGLVSVNGWDESTSRQWLRDRSSYMNQFPFLFDGSLRSNIFPDKDSEQDPYPEFLDRILSKKEMGWETDLTHNGRQLSGGERQLITLARTIVHPRPVVVLDEPTANLDADTVTILLPHILAMAEERLVIVASHEPVFESAADTVVHLNWGEQEPNE